MPSDGSMGQGLGSLGWEQEVLRPQGGWVVFSFFFLIAIYLAVFVGRKL